MNRDVHHFFSPWRGFSWCVYAIIEVAMNLNRELQLNRIYGYTFALFTTHLPLFSAPLLSLLLFCFTGSIRQSVILQLTNTLPFQIPLVRVDSIVWWLYTVSRRHHANETIHLVWLGCHWIEGVNNLRYCLSIIILLNQKTIPYAILMRTSAHE